MVQRAKTGVDNVHLVRKELADGSIRWYIYPWRKGPQIRSVDGPIKPTLTQDDLLAIAQAYEDAKPSKAGTIRGLVAAYRSDENPDWRRLAASTQKLWGDCLDVILAKWGDFPLKIWNDPRTVSIVMAWRDGMGATPRAADNRVSTLFRLLEYGRLRARVTVNVAAGIPTIYRGGERECIIWTPEDFAVFLAVAKTPVSDAVRLASMTGLRRSDLVGLEWSEVGKWSINRTASKKSAGKRRKVVMPIIPGLRALLDELRTRKRNPGVETVLVTSFGDAWTPTGLNSSFYETRGRCVDKDDKPLLAYKDVDGETHPLRMHDIRGTFATKLMTIPGQRLTDKEIADLLGWSPEQVGEIRRKYVDDAAIVVALGKRLANTDVNQTVNQTNSAEESEPKE